MQTMYADVVVDTYTSPWGNLFTYSVPPELFLDIKIGQQVTVPFGKRKTAGWVVDLKKTAHGIEHVKDIVKIDWPLPVISPLQLKIARFMAEHYFAPLVDCLKLMVPDLPRRPADLPKHKLPEKLVTGHPSPVTVILIPSLNFLSRTLEKYKLKSTDVIVWMQDLPKLEKFNRSLRVARGEKRIIIGTRTALFAPYPKLEKIIIEQEHSSAYTDARSPYWNAVTVAAKIAGETGAKLILKSQTPSIETYVAHRQNLVLEKPRLSPKTWIVDTVVERKMGTAGILSEKAVELIKFAQRKHSSVLIFLNKIKESGNFYCRECRHTDWAATPPAVCHKCGSADIKFYSANIAKLKEEVAAIAGANNLGIYAAGEKPPSTQFTLATAVCLFDPTVYNFIIAAAADTSLNMANYNSSFDTFATLWTLGQKSRQGFLIQTYNPSHPVIQAAAEKNYVKFASTEIADRSTLGFPPFSTIAKISISAATLEKAESESQTLLDELSFNIQHPKSNVELTGPLPSYSTPRPTWSIIAKAKDRKSLEPILEMVPKKDAKIEIEPRQI